MMSSPPFVVSNCTNSTPWVVEDLMQSWKSESLSNQLVLPSDRLVQLSADFTGGVKHSDANSAAPLIMSEADGDGLIVIHLVVSIVSSYLPNIIRIQVHYLSLKV